MIELMVVVTIIGVLMAMMFPAVQVAREGGRKTVCEGNLKNLSQSMFAYMTQDAERQLFPQGGWGSRWLGNPNLSGLNQSGGWAFQILPYMEQGGLYQIGDVRTDGGFDAIRRLPNVLPLHICPSRRIPALFPFFDSGRSAPSPGTMQFAETTTPLLVPRGDYAMNAGDQPLCYVPAAAGANLEDPGPISTSQGIDPSWWANPSNTSLYVTRPGTTPPYDPSNRINYEPSGVSFRRGLIVRQGSVINAEQIDGVTLTEVNNPKGDGRAYVYLLGEKYLDEVRYNTGTDPGDDDALYSGYGNDNYRTAYAPPMKDIQEDPDLQQVTSRRCRFGSAHPYGAHFVFCDGRIKMIAFFVHPLVHAKLANRSDNLLTSVVPGQPPSPTQNPYLGTYWPPRGLETSFPVPNPGDNEY